MGKTSVCFLVKMEVAFGKGLEELSGGVVLFNVLVGILVTTLYVFHNESGQW